MAILANIYICFILFQKPHERKYPLLFKFQLSLNAYHLAKNYIINHYKREFLTMSPSSGCFCPQKTFQNVIYCYYTAENIEVHPNIYSIV